MKKSILTGSHMSRVARVLTQIGYRIALAATPLFALDSAQLTDAQTTIQVTTTQQGSPTTSALCKKRSMPRNLRATQR